MLGTLGEALSDMLHGTNMTINGKCSQCGSCCGSLLPVTDDEIRSIHRYIKKHGIKVCKNTFPVSKALIDLTCPFLDQNKKTEKCRIYEKRPYICKTFTCDKRITAYDMDEFSKNKYHVVDMRKEFGGE